MSWVRLLWRLIFPEQCIYCQCLLTESLLCQKCAKTVPKTRCIRHNLVIAGQSLPVFGMGMYNPDLVLGALIKRYKYGARLDLAAYFARRLYKVLYSEQPALFFTNTAIVPIPSTWRRTVNKGYSHTKILAKTLERITSWPVILALSRTEWWSDVGQVAQSGKQRRQRSLEFQLNSETIAGFDSVVLIDDVLTTGRTIKSAAAVIAERVPSLRIVATVIGVRE